MRSFKKMTAVVMAVATLATSMVPFSADALYTMKILSLPMTQRLNRNQMI